MKFLTEVKVGSRPIDRFIEVIGEDQVGEAMRVAQALRERMGEHVIWNVNSTAVGGGVAEMLQPLLGYVRGIGVDTRWLVIRGNNDFFRVTKRLHHALHGAPGDGSVLGDEDRVVYEQALEGNTKELRQLVRPGDVVILHDPQTAGMAPPLVKAGVTVIWRCHIGHDSSNKEVDSGWHFLQPYLESVAAFVFSRKAYAPDFCDQGRSTIITPSIDAFSAKNVDLDEDTVRTILVHTGLVEGPAPSNPSHSFPRGDGTPGRVERRADVIRLGRAPTWDTPLVVQVSRWDPLKDMLGVMRGFTELVNGQAPAGAELVLAGPNVNAVADDPEGPAVFDAVLQEWRKLPHGVRQHVHLVNLPTNDVEENAAIVNALQRHAAVVVQKSLHEGFGLTVTEAMWKSKPVIASAVGGIQDQIVHGESGLLLKDPTDLASFGQLLSQLLSDEAEAKRIGAAAHERVRDKFLGVSHLLKYGALLDKLDG